MKTIEEMIAVMQAYADGKKIQLLVGEHWKDIEHPDWNWDYDDYRIKPEGRCEYRPYYNSDEFAEDQKTHGPYIKLKSIPAPTILFLPSIVGPSYIVSQKYTSEGLLTEKYDEVFKKYVWQDGTPCGVMEGGEE